MVLSFKCHLNPLIFKNNNNNIKLLMFFCASCSVRVRSERLEVRVQDRAPFMPGAFITPCQYTLG